MRNQRQHAILEIYQLALAVFLFVSPWLFAFAHGTLRIDTWISAAVVVGVSAVALIAFPGMGRVDRVCPWTVDRSVTLGAGLPAHGGDVHQPRRRDLNCVSRAPAALADPLRFACRKDE
jgi:hypothetical protein